MNNGRRARLGVEHLEAREVPATITRTVTSVSDVWNRGNDETELTLREAIADANNEDPAAGEQHLIRFAADLGGHAIILDSDWGQLQLSKKP